MNELLNQIIDNPIWAEQLSKIEPLIYYKDSIPHGFIKLINYRSGVLVLSATKDNQPFTRDMIVFIRSIAKVCRVYILHNKDRKDISDNIIRAFRKRFKAHQLVLKDKCVITIVDRR